MRPICRVGSSSCRNAPGRRGRVRRCSHEESIWSRRTLALACDGPHQKFGWALGSVGQSVADDSSANAPLERAKVPHVRSGGVHDAAQTDDLPAIAAEGRHRDTSVGLQTPAHTMNVRDYSTADQPLSVHRRTIERSSKPGLRYASPRRISCSRPLTTNATAAPTTPSSVDIAAIPTK